MLSLGEIGGVLVRDLPRWLAFLLLMLAPWAYGCTRPWAYTLLAQVSCGILVVWIFWLIFVYRRFPRGPSWFYRLGLSLLVFGWFSVWNARATYIPVRAGFEMLEQLLPGVGGSLSRSDSFDLMLRLSGLFGICMLTVDAMSNPFWRNCLWSGAAANSALWALYGLIQKLAQAPGIYWIPEELSENFFGTFRYHGNAGAFLNVGLALVFGKLFAALPQKSAAAKGVWASALLVMIFSVLANQSKAALIIFVVVASLGISILLLLLLQSSRGTLAQRYLVGITLILAFAASIVALRPEKIFNRIDDLAIRISEAETVKDFDARLVAYQAALPAIRDAGFFGFGPGTFVLVFPEYIPEESEEALTGIWQNLHQDYLETLIDWGWSGGALWLAFFLGALWPHSHCLLRNVWKRLDSHKIEQMAIRWSATVALLSLAAHALVDFPFQIASLQLYALFLAGILWGMGGVHSTRKRPPQPSSNEVTP